MQTQHLESIASHAFEDKLSAKEHIERAFKTAEIIATETFNLPDGARTPFATEIAAMEIFGRNYIKQSPNASKRQVRNAIKKAFNIHILPNIKKK